MKRSIVHSILAALTISALVACSSGGANQTVPPSGGYPASNTPPSTTGNAVLAKIVGVGDSLTAGEQSDGLVGQFSSNPLGAASANPDIWPSQQYGWWADLYNQAAGGTTFGQAGVASTVLPLIKSPGIGTVLVFNAAQNGLISPQTSCGGLNASAFSVSGALTTRVNANTVPLDLGVPGQLVHEALYQTGPQGSCADVSVAPGSVFQSETTNFYPVLANFAGMTQVQAARSLKPTLTTVWLGHNDLLKYALSGGQFGPTPASSIQSDLTTIVQTMYQAGSQVVIGNLLDVLTTPLFVSLPNNPVQVTDPIVTYLTYLTNGGINAGTPGLTAALTNVMTQNGLTAGAYLTFQSMPAVLAYLSGGPVPTGLIAAGEALPATFAASVQSLNNSYNTAIAAVAASTGATLVDIHGQFATVATAAAAINPGICCALEPLGGLTSYDMLHPSVTGYALVANVWIAAINAKFGTAIPSVNIATAYAQDPYAPGSPIFGASKFHLPGR